MMSSCPTGRRILGFGTHPEIAAALQLTDGTVKHYLTALFKKLDVRNRLQAIQVAKTLQTS